MDFWMMFVLGLVSSLHCLQMCGPIVLSYSAASGFAPTRLASPGKFSFASLPHHLAYNFGRIVTYSMLGTVAGLLGRGVDFAGRLAGVSRAAMIVSGILMVSAGVLMLISTESTSRLGNASLRVTARLLKPLARFMSSPNITDRFYLGLGLGFLPCGLVYMALLRSLGAGSPYGGALSMLAFGLGTAGALLALGLFSSVIKMRFARFGSRVAAVGVMALGLFLVLRSSLFTGVMAGMGACHGHH